jgi:hypothetical protein
MAVNKAWAWDEVKEVGILKDCQHAKVQRDKPGHAPAEV